MESLSGAKQGYLAQILQKSLADLEDSELGSLWVYNHNDIFIFCQINNALACKFYGFAYFVVQVSLLKFSGIESSKLQFMSSNDSKEWTLLTFRLNSNLPNNATVFIPSNQRNFK